MSAQSNDHGKDDHWQTLASLTAQIISAFVANNSLSHTDLPALTEKIRDILGMENGSTAKRGFDLEAALDQLTGSPRKRIEKEKPARDADAVALAVYRPEDNVQEPAAAKPPLRPAVPLQDSIFEDHLVCLEDGRKMVTLRAHLKKAHNLTPPEYRKRWGLPANYPMVCPDHSARRKKIAQKIGLGEKITNPMAELIEPHTSIIEKNENEAAE